MNDPERKETPKHRRPERPEPEARDPRAERSVRLAQALVAAVDPRDRAGLRDWAVGLSNLRGSSMSAARKAKKAVALTYRSGIAVKVATVVARRGRDLVWSDRGWAARIGGMAAVATASVAAGKGAGIAALGSAIGVPLWVVFGAGGTFAGAIIDEVSGALEGHDGDPRSATADDEVMEIMEGEYEVISRRELYSADPKQLPPPPGAA